MALTSNPSPENSLSAPDSNDVSTLEDIEALSLEDVSSGELVESGGPPTPPSPRRAPISTTTYYVHSLEDVSSEELVESGGPPTPPSPRRAPISTTTYYVDTVTHVASPFCADMCDEDFSKELVSAEALEVTCSAPEPTQPCELDVSLKPPQRLLAKVLAQFKHGKHDNVRVINVREAVEGKTFTNVSAPVLTTAPEKFHKKTKLVCVKEALEENTISATALFHSAADHQKGISDKMTLPSKLPPLAPSLHLTPSRRPALDPPILLKLRSPGAPLPPIQSKPAQERNVEHLLLVREQGNDGDDNTASVWSCDAVKTKDGEGDNNRKKKRFLQFVQKMNCFSPKA